MKPLLILALGLAVTACRQEAPHPEILARLKAVETELAKRPAPVRWATADRSKISSALYARSREKMEELKQTEKLSPDQAAKVAEYDALHRELMSRPPRLPSAMVRPPAAPALPPLPPKELSAGLPTLSQPVLARPIRLPMESTAPTAEDKEYEALAKRVAEAKAPVAAFIDRRNQINARYFGGELLEQLVADYMKTANDRYDLVVDSSHGSSFSRPVLHRTAGEVPDITEAIMKFFAEWEKR
jgi:hypothetical protein